LSEKLYTRYTNIHYVHPCSSIISTGDRILSIDIITPTVATMGGGFFGGLLIGYAIKKVVKLIAIVSGLFVAGLAYLQYQQIASFDWNRIEALVSAAMGNATSQMSTGQDLTTALEMSNFGIPLTGSMSAGFAVGFMRG
jgi:uncharacterized membrane protein (Fun14 family)